MSYYPNIKPVIINNNSFGVHYLKPNKYYHISRYGNISLIEDKQYNDPYHETVFNYDVIESSGDRFITIEKDTRLDVLANTYYNDFSLWWVIAMANNIMDGLETVKKDTVLRIPPIMSIYKPHSVLGR